MEQASERKRRSILRTELQWLARGARARSTKQKAHIQRIEDMQNVTAPQQQGKVEHVFSGLKDGAGRPWRPEKSVKPMAENDH